MAWPISTCPSRSPFTWTPATTQPRHAPCLDDLGIGYVISRKGTPLEAGQRWKVERTHSWMNGYGKLRRCTEKNARVVDFYLSLAAALTIIRALIRRARTRYRWPTRPTTRRLP